MLDFVNKAQRMFPTIILLQPAGDEGDNAALRIYKQQKKQKQLATLEFWVINWQPIPFFLLKLMNVFLLLLHFPDRRIRKKALLLCLNKRKALFDLVRLAHFSGVRYCQAERTVFGNGDTVLRLLRFARSRKRQTNFPF